MLWSLDTNRAMPKAPALLLSDLNRLLVWLAKNGRLLTPLALSLITSHRIVLGKIAYLDELKRLEWWHTDFEVVLSAEHGLQLPRAITGLG